jgi:hypothetical protein
MALVAAGTAAISIGLTAAPASAAVSPAATAAAPASHGFATQLLRYGEVAAGLLLLVLMLIGCYAAGRRRRPAAGLEETPPDDEAGYPEDDTDRIPEVFETPWAEPIRTEFVADGPPAGPGLLVPADVGPDPAGPGSWQGSWQGTGMYSTAAGGAEGPAAPSLAEPMGASAAPPRGVAPAPEGKLPWTSPRQPAPTAQQAAPQPKARESAPPDDPPRGSLFRRPASQHPQASPAEPAGWPSLGSPASWARPASAADPAEPATDPTGWNQLGGWNNEPDSRDRRARPRVTKSGLPVRPPRSARPASTPGGSAWDPFGSAPADHGKDSRGQGNGPIYVWNPDTAAADLADRSNQE